MATPTRAGLTDIDIDPGKTGKGKEKEKKKTNLRHLSSSLGGPVERGKLWPRLRV